MSITIQNEAEDYLCSAQRLQCNSVSACQNHASTTSWRKWLDFCAWRTIDPDLSGVSDPILYLQIFVYRFRLIALAASDAGAKKRTV